MIARQSLDIQNQNKEYFREQQELIQDEQSKAFEPFNKINHVDRLNKLKGYRVDEQDIKAGKKDIQSLKAQIDLQLYGTDHQKLQLFEQAMKKMIKEAEEKLQSQQKSNKTINLDKFINKKEKNKSVDSESLQLPKLSLNLIKEENGSKNQNSENQKENSKDDQTDLDQNNEDLVEEKVIEEPISKPNWFQKLKNISDQINRSSVDQNSRDQLLSIISLKQKEVLQEEKKQQRQSLIQSFRKNQRNSSMVESTQTGSFMMNLIANTESSIMQENTNRDQARQSYLTPENDNLSPIKKQSIFAKNLSLNRKSMSQSYYIKSPKQKSIMVPEKEKQQFQIQVIQQSDCSSQKEESQQNKGQLSVIGTLNVLSNLQNSKFGSSPLYSPQNIDNSHNNIIENDKNQLKLPKFNLQKKSQSMYTLDGVKDLSKFGRESYIQNEITNSHRERMEQAELEKYQQKQDNMFKTKEKNKVFIDKYYKEKLLGIQQNSKPQYTALQLKLMSEDQLISPFSKSKSKLKQMMQQKLLNSNYGINTNSIQAEIEDKIIKHRFGTDVLQKYNDIHSFCNTLQGKQIQKHKKTESFRKDYEQQYQSLQNKFSKAFGQRSLKFWNMKPKQIEKYELKKKNKPKSSIFEDINQKDQQDCKIIQERKLVDKDDLKQFYKDLSKYYLNQELPGTSKATSLNASSQI